VKKKKKLTLYIFPIRGDGGTEIILADGALPGSYTCKILDTKGLHGIKEKCF